MGVVRRHEAASVLGIDLPATPARIEAAFRRVARSAHPDRHGDPATFRRAVIARKVLVGTEGRSDPEPARRARVVITTRRARWQRLVSRRRRRLARRLGRRSRRVR
jgi:hypothetical protein